MNPLRKTSASMKRLRPLMTSLALAMVIVPASKGQVAAPTQPPATTNPVAAPGELGTSGTAEPDQTRYRFVERYTVESDPKAIKPGELSQYRVACRDVLRIVTEKPQGTPDRKEMTVQVIYSERPAAVNASGMVTDSIRRYETLKISPLPPDARPGDARPLDGLTIWYKTRPNTPGLILSLSPNHPLSEVEYSITKQLVYLPDLSTLLLTTPKRIGERWRVERTAARTLFGEDPIAGEGLAATLAEIKPAANGTDMVAVINVTGSAELGLSRVDNSLNAQVSFTFAKPAMAGPAPATASATPSVDAPGAITEVRLARSSTSQAPGGNGRLKSAFTWELTLQRQTAPGATSAPIPMPSKEAQIATQANTWLVYNDPKGRFHFRHPQDLLPQRGPALEEGLVQLFDQRMINEEVRSLTIRLQPKTGKPAEDKAILDPDAHVKELKDEWARTKQKFTIDKQGLLPKADWAPNKMDVFRVEATVRPPSGRDGKVEPPIFLDHYLVKFTQNESLAIDAMTGQAKPEPFRKDVEEILKTFQLGPYKPGM